MPSLKFALIKKIGILDRKKKYLEQKNDKRDTVYFHLSKLYNALPTTTFTCWKRYVTLTYV